MKIRTHYSPLQLFIVVIPSLVQLNATDQLAQ